MMLKKSLLFFAVILIVLLSSCAQDVDYVDVKYRDTPVNVAASQFEYLNTDISTFIDGAWYDKQKKYMIIKLNEVHYHYCGLPEPVWNDFKKAESFGTFYNQFIKGHYDCREGYIPGY